MRIVGDFPVMSFSISDGFSDSAGALSTDSPAPFSDEESIVGFMEDECNFAQTVDQSAELRPIPLDSSDRAHSVSWILKVGAYYGFQDLTAYLAVNYLDRFLSSYRLPQSNGWTLQLLSVACLSLAAKMEEPLVPLLHHFQVEGAKFVFSPRTIQNMELLVLDVLDWRLRTVTPFDFIGFFTRKVDATATLMGYLTLRATDIILRNLQEASLLEHRRSSIAAAAVLCAASEIPNLSLVTPEHAESWCDGLTKEKVIDCYRLMQHVMMRTARKSDRARVWSSSCSTSDCSSPSVCCSCSSSSSTSPSYTNKTKRRRLSTTLSWENVDLLDGKIKYETE